MAREVGTRGQTVMAFETVYGTPPVTGYRVVPYAKNTLGKSQPLLESELLGLGRDPQVPIKDVVTAGGELTIPIDVENLGLWLKALFGNPVTTGTTPKVHTYQSGGFVLPSFSVEKQLPSLTDFEMIAGCMADTFEWEMTRGGLLTGSLGIVAQKADTAVATAAGAPTSLTLTRFGHFNGAIKRDTVALGTMMSSKISYMNNLDPVETIRADGLIEGIDPGEAMLSGTFRSRIADLTLITQATSGVPCELEFSYSLGANASFVFTAHACYMEIAKRPIEGPRGIQVDINWKAAKATTPARMCTAVLTNTVAAY